MSDRDKPIPKTRDALEERAKELACLYEIGNLLKDPEAAAARRDAACRLDGYVC